MRDVSTLKNLINVEFKYHDVTGSALTVDSLNGTFQLLNGISQGDGASSRDGNQIRIKSIESRMTFNTNASTPTSGFVRCIWFIDLQAKGTAPVQSDLLQTHGPVSIVWPRNLDNRSRFLILKDKTFALNAQEKRIIPFHWYKEMDMKQVFDAAGGLIGDISSKPIYCFTVGDLAVNKPTFNSVHRVRYIDN